MSPSRLRIDTSVARIQAQTPTYVLSRDTVTSAPTHRQSSKPRTRVRSASSASASSSTSDPSRALSKVAVSLVHPHSAYPSTADPHVPDHSNWSPTYSSSGESDPGSPGYVLAMHDFAPQHQNVTCLGFRAGEVIHVLNRDPSGWWDGEVDGRRGWFPSNYVTSEVGLLTNEELPKPRPRNGHRHCISSASTTSWTSSSSPRSSTFSRSNHRPMGSDSSHSEAYCPPIMIPLLQGISLLQTAVRSSRISHFQPSTACIISCVRSILGEIGCLDRSVEILKQHADLAQERKRILSDLASLVSQAKKASEEALEESQRDVEVEAMVRLGGQLFKHVRDFLGVAVQCGIVVQPPPRPPSSVDSQGQWDSQEGTLVRDDASTPLALDYGEYWESAGGIAQRRRIREPTATPGMRARSCGDLRDTKVQEVPPALPKTKTEIMVATTTGKESWTTTPTASKRYADSTETKHKGAQLSVSSTSSSSSFSSGESVGTPPTPAFPTGPSTTAEVADALQQTHDHYLSTIAAFIGHAHSHSRSSHASSTGHMYDLVREVVEMVCKLLTIVEAVLRHPDIPTPRAQHLRFTKENLYTVTSTLADAVRNLTTTPNPDISEEEEKATLLQSATNALKAGSDCVAAVKKCLQRPAGERSLVINLPDINSAMYNVRRLSAYAPSRHSVKETSSMKALRKVYVVSGGETEDEDSTVQAQEPTVKVFEALPISQETSPAGSLVDMVEDVAPTPTSSEGKHPPIQPREPATPAFEQPPTSPSSLATTDDDRTTWEGGVTKSQPPQQQQPQQPSPKSLEEKLLNGELPAVPEIPIPNFPRPDSLSWILSHDHAPDDVAYNSDGQLVGASLGALVERMTPHDSLVEPAFASVFFLTFRQFTTPVELLDALIARYNIVPPENASEQEIYVWQQRKGLPVRLRVSNFVKSWLETHWRPQVDNVVLNSLFAFTRDALGVMFPNPSQRIMELIHQWQTCHETGITPKMISSHISRDAGIPLNPPSVASVITVSPSEVPRPIMTKNLLGALRNKNYPSIAIVDFDALELARQLTVMESGLYCAIQPEEVLETGQKGGAAAVLGNVKAVTSFSTAITGWVAESILDELDTKKRTALVKFFIKVADRCTALQNFSTPRSILAALDSSTISRLHLTWSGLPQKNRLQLEAIRKLADHARNYHEYRTRLRNTAPPAVPFLGLYLTDITFCREGNPSHRNSPGNANKKLLNFNKYHKLARIVQDMQRFQVAYNLKEIPEVREYLDNALEQSKQGGDLQDLYRRSLLVEPKQPADTPPTSDVRQLFGWASRSQPHQATPTSA